MYLDYLVIAVSMQDLNHNICVEDCLIGSNSRCSNCNSNRNYTIGIISETICLKGFCPEGLYLFAM